MAWRNKVVVSYESGFDKEDLTAQGPSTTNAFVDRHTGQHAKHRIATNTRDGGVRFVADFRGPEIVSLRAGYWMLMLSADTTRHLFSFRENTGSSSWSLRSRVRIRTISSGSGGRRDTLEIISNSGSGDSSLFSQIPISLTEDARYLEWTHYGLVVINKSSARLYINGKHVLSGNLDFPSIPNPFNPVEFWMFEQGASGSSSTVYVDDLYLDVSDEVEDFAPPPPLRFRPFFLQAQGNEEQWKTTDPRRHNAWTVQANSATTTNNQVFADAADMLDLYRVGAIDEIEQHQLVALGAHVHGDFTRRGINLVTKLGTGQAELPVFKFDTGYIAPGVVSYKDPDGDDWTGVTARQAQIGIKSL